MITAASTKNKDITWYFLIDVFEGLDHVNYRMCLLVNEIWTGSS